MARALNLLRKPVAAVAPQSTLPPIYAAPGRITAVEHCIRLAKEELKAIDQLPADHDDVKRMRREISNLLSDYRNELDRIVEPAVPAHWRERHEQIMRERSHLISYNIDRYRSGVEQADAQGDFKQSVKRRRMLIRLPDAIEKGETT